MRADIRPGSVFPDYELSDHTATRRKLSDLQGQHPLVLVLSRGGFCPKDRRPAELLVQLHREIEVAYCRLVTISTDNLLETNNIAPESAHTGRSYRMQVGPFRRTLILLSTQIRHTIP
jgi:peroxiredoxin